MKREERLREELEEAWFALVVEKIAQQEGAELNALNEQLKNDPQYAVPEELDRRSMETIQRLVTQDKRKRRGKAAGKIFMRVACAAMIATMMLGTIYASLPSARKTAILNLLIEVGDVSTRLVLEDVEQIDKESESTTNAPKVLLGYRIPELPEGFAVTDEKHTNNLAWIEYEDDTNNTLRFRFCNGVSGSVEVDTEKTDKTPVRINEIDGHMWTKDNITKIAWSDPNSKIFISVEGVGVDPSFVEDLAEKVCLAE